MRTMVARKILLFCLIAVCGITVFAGCEQPPKEAGSSAVSKKDETSSISDTSKPEGNIFGLAGYTEVDQEFTKRKLELDLASAVKKNAPAETDKERVEYSYVVAVYGDTVYHYTTFGTEMAQFPELGSVLIAQEIGSKEGTAVFQLGEGGPPISYFEQQEEILIWQTERWDDVHDHGTIFRYNMKTKKTSFAEIPKPADGSSELIYFDVKSPYVLSRETTDQTQRLHIKNLGNGKNIYFPTETFSHNNHFPVADILGNLLVFTTKNQAPAKITLYDLLAEKAIREIELEQSLSVMYFIDEKTIAFFDSAEVGKELYLLDLDSGEAQKIKGSDEISHKSVYNNNLVITFYNDDNHVYFIDPGKKIIAKHELNLTAINYFHHKGDQFFWREGNDWYILDSK